MDNTILKFLLGEGELEGVWFGDKHPNYVGSFWWRYHLREYLEQAQLQQPVVSGKRPDCPYCIEPISAEAIARWDNWLKNVKAACASSAVDKTVSGGSCLKSCSPSDWQTKCKENGCNTE